MGDDILPYHVEYSKSGRASCKACKGTIEKDVLRLATVVQSPIFDGKMMKWYHADCFFTKQRPQSIADIAQFDNIRWEDQELIKKKIEESTDLPTGKGRKRGANKSTVSDDLFRIEYAKSSRSTCCGCQEKIIKDEMRVSRKDFESEDARQYGGIDRWHHLECFARLREEFKFFASGNTLPGTKSLSKEDQATLIKTLPKIKEENIPPSAKKIKKEPDNKEEEELLKKQNVKMFKIRDELKNLQKQQLISLLEENHQGIPEGISNMLDNLSDVMAFGSLQPCPQCKGQLVYQYGVGYKCTGNLTEWTKCDYSTTEPTRVHFKIPTSLRDHSFLKKYKSKISKRFVKVIAPSTSAAVKKEEKDSGPKVEAKPRPLKNMSFVLSGNLKTDKKALTREICLLGGTVVTKIHENLAAVISTPEEVAKMDKKMERIKALDIQVVSEDFVTEAKDFTTAPIMLINKKNISTWGGDPAKRIPQNVEKSKSGRKSRYEKSSSGKVKLRVKGGGTVDPESELQDKAHVHQEGEEKFTVTLGITDIQSKKNSFYKMQILKHDKQNKYWLFRSWGRIGTTIGGNKLEEASAEECIKMFNGLYFEKTGNLWSSRNDFKKVPQKMYPIDIDHGEEDESNKNILNSDVKSNLKKPVQDLIRLIFDVNLMKKVMLEFEIDMEKMPLGKISKKQINNAYSVLTELQTIIKSGKPERLKLIDASNRFYTLIPHDFGVSEPTVLQTEKDIADKTQMLESLLEIEIAYDLLHSKIDESKNPLDAHYEQLNTDIDVLEKSSEEFKIIEEYVKNTHAATHSYYDLEIEDVFIIQRQGEDKRFKPFKKLHNRKLLWHGSRTTNFAGILSQGLRIAPPEAPVTGYMFGKGIYFADMVSKSANYCCTDRKNPTGLLLLCEVALGNMYERNSAEFVEKLPKGKHSTKGIGTTHPDPSKVYKTKDGVEIPYGPGVPAKVQRSSLLYNEYIVYDVAQVKAKYLLKMNFKFKG